MSMGCTPLNYRDLLEALQAGRMAGRRVAGVSDRSSDIGPGFVFVARPGQHVDGARFARDAERSGALAVVAEQPLDVGIPCVVVPDAAQALGVLSAAFHGDPSRRLRVTGITGTNGKTTTAALLGAALREGERPVGTIGTLGVQVDGELLQPLAFTTPPAPELQGALRRLLDLGVRDVAMEVSSHALRQQRTAGCTFAAGVFTNWTRDHADYHGDMQRYLEAKGMLFAGLSEQGPGALAVLNLDSPAYPYLASVTRVPIRSYGAKGDVRLLDWHDEGLSGGHGEVQVDGSPYVLRLQLPGRYNVENALAALAAATGLGEQAAPVLDRISHLAGVPGRMHLIEADEPPRRVIVDYAHNPAGLAHLLRTVRRASEGRVISVFGGRGERDRGKRPLMGAIAAALADVVIVTVDNPRSEDPRETALEVAGGARDSGADTRIVLDRYEAIRSALREARAGDTVTITGKGAERWDEPQDGRPMTDIQAVQEILQGAS